MLINDFFTIKQKRTEQETNFFEIGLNCDHQIFKAHFPDNPMVPGVCIIEIVKELTKSIFNSNLVIKTIKNVKFLQILSPTQHPEFSCSINALVNSEGKIEVKASIFHDELVFSKLSLILEVVK